MKLLFGAIREYVQDKLQKHGLHRIHPVENCNRLVYTINCLQSITIYAATDPPAVHLTLTEGSTTPYKMRYVKDRLHTVDLDDSFAIDHFLSDRYVAARDA